MSKHTPVPWNLVKERKPMIATPRWVPEAEIRGKGGMRTVVRLGKLTNAEAEANAEFIVRACNAHDDLLGALKQLSAALDDFDFDPALQAAARAAIAKTEGPKPESRLMVDVPFPECSKKCEVIEMLGAGECDSVCPHKWEECECGYPDKDECKKNQDINDVHLRPMVGE